MPDWPLIATPRLRLRAARPDDLPAIEAALADIRFPSNLPLARMLRESRLSSWLRRMTSDPQVTRLWAVTSIAADTCIGTVSLVEEESPGTWWLSYWLSPAEWSKGFASEAVASLLSAAALREPYAHVVAAVATDNLPSIRLLHRIGFAETSSARIAQAVPDGHITMQRWLRAQGDA